MGADLSMKGKTGNNLDQEDLVPVAAVTYSEQESGTHFKRVRNIPKSAETKCISMTKNLSERCSVKHDIL